MSEFEEDLQAADDLYESGKYSGVVKACSLALKCAQNDEQTAIALKRRGWAARYDGFKSKDEMYKKAAYEMARKDWRKVLELSSDINLRISAIKGLMLLPEEDGEELYQMSITAIDKHAENLKAGIGNSYGLMVRQEDPRRATLIFLNAYETVEKGTIIAGHLMQNVGTCYLILKGQEEIVFQKRHYSIEAIKYLKIAMEEYPENQLEHRRSTQGKIDRTREEMETEAITTL